jgi:hypothetical protein
MIPGMPVFTLPEGVALLDVREHTVPILVRHGLASIINTTC